MSKKIIITHFSAIDYLPPLRNLAVTINKNSKYNIYIIGYDKINFHTIESLGKKTKIIRIKLFTRRIRFNNIRKLFMGIELYLKMFIFIKRIKPNYLFSFDIYCCLLFIFFKDYINTKIAWLLEYDDISIATYLNKLILKLLFKSTNYSEILVFPSKERSALFLSQKPECINKKIFIIHNSPCDKIVSIDNIKNINIENIVNKINNKKINIIYTGAMGEGYGLESIITAAGNNSTKYDLHLFGSINTESDNINKQYHKMLLNMADKYNNIFFHGSIEYKYLYNICLLMDIGYVTYKPYKLNTYFAAPGKLYEYLRSGLFIFTDINNPIDNDLNYYKCAKTFPADPTPKCLIDILYLLDINDIILGKTNSRKLFNDIYCFDKQYISLNNYLEKNNTE